MTKHSVVPDLVQINLFSKGNKDLLCRASCALLQRNNLLPTAFVTSRIHVGICALHKLIFAYARCTHSATNSSSERDPEILTGVKHCARWLTDVTRRVVAGRKWGRCGHCGGGAGGGKGGHGLIRVSNLVQEFRYNGN